MAERIGFIGLGIMGKPMARNLVKAAAGYEVVIHSRTRASVDELVAESKSFIAAESPTEVAEQADIVITMLPDSPDVRDVVFGEAGLINEARPGLLLIDMSTIAPATSIEIAAALEKRGASALDAPVSGGERGAITAALSIMVGGDPKDFERAKPVFEALGKTIVHVGATGAGQIVKACNQVVVALNYAAVSEALVLGAKAGADPEKIAQVLGGGLAASRVLELKGASMIAHNFQPGFRIDLHRKDLGIALATARQNGSPLPLTALVSQFFDALSVDGKGNLDHSALLTFYEDLAKTEV